MDLDQPPMLRLVSADERAEPPARTRPDLARYALGAAAVLQMTLGLAQIAGFHVVDVVNGGHVSNESAAWNFALGAALLGVARAGRCHCGVLAILTAFVATLTLLTVTDLLSGRVGLARLGTHALLITGFLLVLGLNRRTRPGGPGNPVRAGTSRARARTNAVPHSIEERTSC